MMTEILDYDLVKARQMIGEIRIKAIEYVAGLALSANAIPIAVGAFFDLTQLGEQRDIFVAYSIAGWVFSILSISVAMLFIVTVPKHIERYTRGWVLNHTYWVAPTALILSIVCFAIATFHALDLPAPQN